MELSKLYNMLRASDLTQRIEIQGKVLTVTFIRHYSGTQDEKRNQQRRMKRLYAKIVAAAKGVEEITQPAGPLVLRVHCKEE